MFPPTAVGVNLESPPDIVESKIILNVLSFFFFFFLFLFFCERNVLSLQIKKFVTFTFKRLKEFLYIILNNTNPC